MTSDTRRLLLATGLLLGVVLAVLFAGRAREELSPEPRRALVAIEVEGSGTARTGRVEVATGVRFTLHAVLEAEDWRGRLVYYTEADSLEVDGEAVPLERLRRWSGPNQARVLWFTVRGVPPYLESTDGGIPPAFAFREVFQPDWPLGWSAPGTVVASEQRLESTGRLAEQEFGTQRYHVRIELYGPESSLRPRARFRSAGADRLPGGADRFATVVSPLPGALSVPSRVFGLTQIELGPEASMEARATVADWTGREVAFSRTALLRRHLEAVGRSWDELEWRAVEPGVDPWGEPGDLVRVGARLVFAYRDVGVPGVLDEQDIVLDFDRGAKLARLGEVFLGDGLVERSSAR